MLGYIRVFILGIITGLIIIAVVSANRDRKTDDLQQIKYIEDFYKNKEGKIL